MDLYQVYSIKVWAEDRAKVDDILVKHASNIDDVRISAQRNSNGFSEATYWIKPYDYEDFETIVNELKQAGIQLI